MAINVCVFVCNFVYLHRSVQSSTLCWCRGVAIPSSSGPTLSTSGRVLRAWPLAAGRSWRWWTLCTTASWGTGWPYASARRSSSWRRASFLTKSGDHSTMWSLCCSCDKQHILCKSQLNVDVKFDRKRVFYLYYLIPKKALRIPRFFTFFPRQ